MNAATENLMPESKPKADASLIVRRTYPVPPARLLKAWSDPADLMKWFGPQGLDTPVAEIDFRVGGRYRFGMRPLPDGELIFVNGEYREIGPARIQFTWSFEKPGEARDTLVTIDFREVPGGSELVLMHELFATEKQRQGHQTGWTGILEKLAISLNQ